MNREIKKILVANRGEIALRIMRTIREMEKESVAVYSDVDTTMPFVLYADEAYPLDGREARDTYLDIDKILSAAKKAGADAVHPGYGFLSENSEFARRVEEAGLVFIGPPHRAIKAMGDKTEARKLVAASNVPVVPGTAEPVSETHEAMGVAARIGYPVLVKAAAGGGGKGMRLVRNPEEMESSLRGARSEAKSAFGDDRVFIEKYVQDPRHIEFQILADKQGRVIHLFERECSIQRRHQKVVEETPSMALSQELREEMGKAAVNAARACGYTNAGTVEFILGSDGKYYFLEMNTRLQVEHPITEMTTGIDIVREQINIAEGRGLSFTQEEVRKRGHAIECRIYAEDVSNGFLPSTGDVKLLRPPQGNWVRVDSGVETGNEVSVYYDPMIAKLSVWDATRDAAIKKMVRALDEFVVLGLQTTIPFCRYVMLNSEFREGKYSTHFVERNWTPANRDGVSSDEGAAVSAVLAGANIAADANAGRSKHKAFSNRSTWMDGRFED